MARLAFAVAALIGTVALGGAALAANASVAMTGAQFFPSAVTVNVGESVTWTNQDGIPHSARADDGSFDTGVFSTGSQPVTFAQAGTFGYFCAVHPAMRGTVNVAGAATPPPPTPAPATPPPATAAPTPAPTPAPTVRPTPPPPTVVPSTPTASPTLSPTHAPTPTPAATSLSPTTTAVAVQISPTSPATAVPDALSRSGDGTPPLLLIGAAAVLALAGAGFALSRRR